ncbi:MAG: hypothetical protein A2381_06605 [Bdellovibrionales bacterium RIFOXYB1_FULL_37_110]|nr:MAG: hypothetical protein A2181_08625 [Bdellovibrionales bacterium RIFOXYA1_FULL_38_20]OFZ50212.1 MAG: hypothetical protein A2417_19455 [Bdellovibrionales bacterium RIFOXYC1_FULL_37_79]OFZ57649.1 MAG: hypothetical protein A2381_06605 [Bdellovibrionales bacterium RIFOXYB1_FULL_37_110]OFZ61416.1 MAG: hypothetical protein A2577_00970 [Bdellovibrionales bacterium RIFOXYD1_FULL_36_51]
MKLTELLSNYHHLRLAGASDHEAIADFLKATPMSFGDISVHYEFKQSIWKFLKYQGGSCYVFLLIDQHRICGYGVFSTRDYYILGTKYQAGYLSDLRIARHAVQSAKSQWKEFMNQMFSNINQIEEFQELTYFYAAVFEKNVRALKLFQNEKFPVIFHPLINYQAISILGRKPILFLKPNKSSSHFTLSKAQNSDQVALQHFLHLQNKKKFWGEYFNEADSDEWKRRTHSWDEYNINDFFIAKDNLGKIVFCTLPWSAHNSRKLVVDQISLLYRILGKIFKIIGKKELKLHSPLNNYYLTHFEMSHDLSLDQKREIFTIFLNELYKTKFQRHYHSIIFCDYYDQAIDEVLKDYMCIKTAAIIYQILPKNDQSRKIENIHNLKKQMTFEAAIV